MYIGSYIFTLKTCAKYSRIFSVGIMWEVIGIIQKQYQALSKLIKYSFFQLRMRLIHKSVKSWAAKSLVRP